MFNPMKLFKSEKDKRVDKIKESCGCVCYCKDCDEPLNDTSKVETLSDGVYQYTCVSCGSKSIFNFNIAPVPILID